MGYFEDWKGLMLQPDSTIRKMKGSDGYLLPLAYAVFTSLVAAAALAIGPSATAMAQMLGMIKIGALEFAEIYAVYAFAAFFASYYIVHWVARRLGGKGEYRNLLHLAAFAYFPFSLLSLVMFIPAVGMPLAMLAGLASAYCIWIKFKYLRLRYELSVARSA
jgi:hypothetical protein